MKRAEKITTLLFMALGVAYLLAAHGYTADARLIPTFVAGAFVLVALIQWAGPYFPALVALVKESTPYQAGKMDLSFWKRAGTMVAWSSLLVLTIYSLGLVVAVPLFMVSFLLLQDRGRWLLAAIMALAMGTMTYLLVVVLLELPWDDGILWSLF